MAIIQVLLSFLLPLGLVYAEEHSRVLKVLSPVVICYVLGVLIGNIGWFGGIEQEWIDYGLAESLAEVSVALSIPLLLFSTEIMNWIQYAGKMVLSFSLMGVAVVVSAVSIAYGFGDSIGHYPNVAGMAVGVYLGGTPNLSALQVALGEDGAVFGAMQTSDLVVSALYLVFLMTIAQRVIGKILPRFSSGNVRELHIETNWNFFSLSLWGRIKAVLLSVGAGALVLGLSIGLCEIGGVLFALHNPMSWVILTLSALSLGASLIPQVRQLAGAYETGEFLLLVFCFSLGLMVNIDELVASMGSMMLYMGAVVSMSVSIHLFLAWLFRVDVDTFLISSTAGIFGPPFIGPMAKVLGNRRVLGPGITTGLIGLAVGNFMGVLVARLFF